MFIPNQTQGIKGECSTCVHWNVCSKVADFRELKKNVDELEVPESKKGLHVTVKCDDYVDVSAAMQMRNIGGCF